MSNTVKTILWLSSIAAVVAMWIFAPTILILIVLLTVIVGSVSHDFTCKDPDIERCNRLREEEARYYEAQAKEECQDQNL